MADVDVASLGLAVDTSQIQNAQAILNRLSQSGQAAAQSLNTFGQAANRAGQAAQQQAQVAAQSNVVFNRATGQFTQATQQQAQAAAAFNAATTTWAPAAVRAAANTNQLTTAVTQTGQAAGLSAQQLTFLGFQVNDVFTSLASGMSVATVAAQQGGQFFQIFSSHPQGLSAGLREAAQWFGRLFTVGRVALGGLAAGALAVVVAWNRFQDLQVSVNTTLEGLGRNVGLTTDQFMNLAQQMASANNLSTRQATEFGVVFARTGRLSAENIVRLTGLTKDFAATMGVTGDEAAQALAKAFSTPQGIIQLNQQLSFMDARVQATVQSLFAQGRAQEAVNLALANLRPALSNYEQNLGLITRGWEGIKRAISEADITLGRWLDRMTSNRASESIRQIQMRLLEAEKTARNPEGGDSVSVPVPPQRLSGRPRFGEAPSAQSDRGMFARRENFFDRYNDASGYDASSQGQAANAFAVAVRQREENLNRLSRQLQESMDHTVRGSREWRGYADGLKLVEEATKTGNQALADRLVSTKDLGEFTEILRHQQESMTNADGTRMTQEQRRIEQNRIELEQMKVRSNEQDAALAKQEAIARNRGRDITPNQAAIEQQHAETLVRERKRIAIEEDIHVMDREAQTYGKVGAQREIASRMSDVELQYRRQNMALSPQELRIFEERIAKQRELQQVQAQLDSIYNQAIKPAEDYNNVLKAATQLFQQGKINAEQYGIAVDAARIKMLQSEGSARGGVAAGFLGVAADFGNQSRQLEQFVTSSASTISSSLADMAMGTKSVKDSFADMGQSIGRALMDMMIRMIILAPVARTLSNLLSGIPGFGTAGGGGLAMPGLYASPIGPGLPGMASGGSLSFGQRAIVGERRPEIVEGPAYIDPHLRTANSNVQIVVNEAPGGDRADVSASRGPGGDMTIVVDMIEARQASKIARGQGPMARMVGGDARRLRG